MKNKTPIKITICFDDPTHSSSKIKKTFNIFGKKKETWITKFIKMMDSGMIIVPVQISCQLKNTTYIRDILISSPANLNNKLINNRSLGQNSISKSQKDDTQSIWKYDAVDSSGHPVCGSVSSNSQSETISKIRSLKYFPTKIVKPTKKTNNRLLSFWKKFVNPKKKENCL